MINITFLGTGDQIPSRTRNHTAILLNFKSENLLFDCGEGTQRQFRKADLNPYKVTRVLISHWHGDHVLGIPGLLSTLALGEYNRTLFIYGPEGIKEKIRKVLEVFNFHRDYKIEIKEVKSGVFYEGKDFYLECEEMDHGIPSLAYSFIKKGYLRIDKEKLKKSKIPKSPILQKLKDGEDIIYEGKEFKSKDLTYAEKEEKVSIVMDTKMNKRVIPFVKNSNLFISEGTYLKDLAKEAEEHMHLTVSQAAEIAKRAKVEKLILTHISSRHIQDLKYLLSEARKIFKKSYLVKDLDRVEV